MANRLRRLTHEETVEVQSVLRKVIEHLTKLQYGRWPIRRRVDRNGRR